MEISYSFEVTGDSIEDIFDKAWKRAEQLFNDPPLTLHEFHRFNVSPQLIAYGTGEALSYRADVTVVRHASIPVLSGFLPRG